jgi:hypothetical protein
MTLSHAGAGCNIGVARRAAQGREIIPVNSKINSKLDATAFFGWIYII